MAAKNKPIKSKVIANDFHQNASSIALDPPSESGLSMGAGIATVATTAMLLEACGGGSTGNGSGGAKPTDSEAARFLNQATMGATRAQIDRVKSLGYAAWLDEQFAMPAKDGHWNWLKARGFNIEKYKFQEDGLDQTLWRKLITAPDALRQRLVLALSEILVVSVNGVDTAWRQFAVAAYVDILEAYCFGNYRDLLQAISTNPAMGVYLTFAGNEMANPETGANPDENFARELMQLFTIGLLQLNVDGTPKAGALETYKQADISQLARVFTGWDLDLQKPDGSDYDLPDWTKRPMKQYADRHETGASTFLGGTVRSGLNGVDSLKAALDIIFAHPNIAPFISRQLIQKLVTSNPSSGYVARVAAMFNNNGKGVKGDLKQVIKTILLDDEARNKANLSNPRFGKVKEPILRYSAWLRAFKASSSASLANDKLWNLGYLQSEEYGLGQAPLRSPSVFNFYRPGYVPPNSSISTAGLVAPELQLANESSIIGYVNMMTNQIYSMATDVDENVKVDYSALIALATNPAVMVKELSLLLTADQLSAASLKLISDAISQFRDNKLPASDPSHYLKNRVYAAILMVIASPEFLVSK